MEEQLLNNNNSCCGEWRHKWFRENNISEVTKQNKLTAEKLRESEEQRGGGCDRGRGGEGGGWRRWRRRWENVRVLYKGLQKVEAVDRKMLMEKVRTGSTAVQRRSDDLKASISPRGRDKSVCWLATLTWALAVLYPPVWDPSIQLAQRWTGSSNGERYDLGGPLRFHHSRLYSSFQTSMAVITFFNLFRTGSIFESIEARVFLPLPST